MKDNKESKPRRIAKRKDENYKRNAAGLITLLGVDYQTAVKRLKSFEKAFLRDFPNGSPDTAFEWGMNARDVVRTFFAYVEGTVYSLKIYVELLYSQSITPLTSEEINAVYEETYIVNDKGEVEIKSMPVKLIPNILFMIKLQEKAHKISANLDKNSDWWQALVKSIATRNSLMHPKAMSDLSLDKNNADLIYKAYEGFHDLLVKFLGKKPWSLPDIQQQLLSKFIKSESFQNFRDGPK